MISRLLFACAVAYTATSGLGFIYSWYFYPLL